MSVPTPVLARARLRSASGTVLTGSLTFKRIYAAALANGSPRHRRSRFAGSNSEIYDPATEFGRAQATSSPRGEHTSTLLPNGKVLVAGGITVLTL
jgi:hypothetical protein